MKISKNNKLLIYEILKKESGAFPDTDDQGIIPFLSEIWDLSSLPSEDNRYKNAMGDFTQHLVRNDDYSYEYVFEERLDLINDDEKFVKFLEAIVAPKFRDGEDDILKFIFLLNPILERDNLAFVLKDYDDKGEPLYLIDDRPAEGSFTDVPPNNIPFFLVKEKTKELNLYPSQFPAFVLCFNDGWNDYWFWSSYHLYYLNSKNEEVQDIGSVKIIYEEEKSTNEFIDSSFTELGTSFCSLGQDEEYYYNLKAVLKNKVTSILYALKDAAIFPDIQDRFENTIGYKKSLIRFDEAERLAREAKYKLYDYEISEELYKFRYHFTPPYSNSPLDIEFDFDNKQPLPNRIYAIIGKNGTGKTQLITSLPLQLSRNDDECFSPKTPYFSKIIAVSYSIFDRFQIPTKSSRFNYIYCGIKKSDTENFTERGLIQRFHNSWKKIESYGRINKWRRILLTFIDSEMVDTFLLPINEMVVSDNINKYKVDIGGFSKVNSILSSGQSILLYVITEIVANIRYDSILLYDEPETHLHPNAITQLMNTIYELTEEFQSYCIIATHSPLIIRELLSKNVYVMERDGNAALMRRIPLESFGENLSVLTEEIFGNRSIPTQHHKIIRSLVEKGYDFEDITSLLEFDQVPLSLNARMYIRSVIKEFS